jgi:SAM-dependent methyltransferase
MSESRSCAYDEYYYAHDCGRPYQRDDEWLGFFGGIADHIVHDIAPRTALDAGCAMGFLVESLRDRGVEAFGLDISPYAIERVRADVLPCCRVASISEPLPQRYDLIVCIEVLEHLAPPEAELAIANLCAHTDDVLFSSTPDDFREATHVNVQPPEQWAELLAHNGFWRDIDFDATFITPWAGRFRRSRDPLPRAVRAYERKLSLLQKENVDIRGLTGEMRSQLAAQEQELQNLRARVTDNEQTIQALTAQLASITRSRSWRMDQFVRRMLPVLHKSVAGAPGSAERG